MRIKLFFGVIFTYILLTGCEDIEECNLEYYLQTDAPTLIETNGYYRLKFLPEYVQTFATLRAKTGSFDEYQKVKWIANKHMLINNIHTDIINGSSYTDEAGEAFTVLGVYEQLIGDTITVYCGYNNMCYNFIDSLKVIIE